jgi:hypothetical protein
MLSLIGSVLGFGTSFLPKVLNFFEEKRDQKHELSIMDKQLEQQLQLGQQKMQMINVEADIRETETLHKEHAEITKKSSQWVINLSSSVRPIVTYCLLLELGILTLAVNMDWITIEQYQNIWSEEFQAGFFSVMAFWFGQRSFNRK